MSTQKVRCLTGFIVLTNARDPGTVMIALDKISCITEASKTAHGSEFANALVQTTQFAWTVKETPEEVVQLIMRAQEDLRNDGLIEFEAGATVEINVDTGETKVIPKADKMLAFSPFSKKVQVLNYAFKAGHRALYYAAAESMAAAIILKMTVKDVVDVLAAHTSSDGETLDYTEVLNELSDRCEALGILPEDALTGHTNHIVATLNNTLDAFRAQVTK